MSSLGYGDAVILGVVEGLTEFLPVSSTGHLNVVEGLLKLKVDDPAVTAFTAIIQFGAIIATFLYFRSDIVSLVLAWVRGLGPSAGGRHSRDDPEYRFAWVVIAGSIPIAIIGIAAKPLISGPFRNLWVVATALIVWSAVIFWAERNPAQELDEKDLSLRQVLIIGVMQCVALVPGVSRSGATISAGLKLGATRVAATRLSFFLAIPALTGAAILELKDINTSVVGWGQLFVGTLISFIVAYASIAWLLKLVAGHPLSVFIPYRLVAGLTVMGLLVTGVLAAN
jgi:undecaprenyl-diphosphatase